MKNADYRMECHGSLWLTVPLQSAARDFLVEHVSPDAIWWAGALVVEPRYVDSLIAALRNDGFTVTVSDSRT